MYCYTVAIDKQPRVPNKSTLKAICEIREYPSYLGWYAGYPAIVFYFKLRRDAVQARKRLMQVTKVGDNICKVEWWGDKKNENTEENHN